MSTTHAPAAMWTCPRCGQTVAGRFTATPVCGNKDKHPRPVTMTKEQDA